MKQTPDTLLQLADDTLRRVLALGATGAAIEVSASSTLSVTLDTGKTETETRSAHSLLVRLAKGRKAATSATSDLTEAGVESALREVFASCDRATEDGISSVPEAPQHNSDLPDLKLFDPVLAALTTDEAEALANACDESARAQDPRIASSPAPAFDRRTHAFAVATSGGFRGAYEGTTAAQLGIFQVDDGHDEVYLGGEAVEVRKRSALRDPVLLGRDGARRVIALMGARKIATQRLPILFCSHVASQWLRKFSTCILGDVLCETPSYLFGRLGSTVASPLVTIVDDPLIESAIGSRPFDAEGLPSRRNVVVDKGVLSTFLLDTYSARKLRMAPTASACPANVWGRRAGVSNLILEDGDLSFDEILGNTEKGLYVSWVGLLQGDLATGKMPIRVDGHWIENGKIAFPVAGMRISATLDDLLLRIDAVANDRSRAATYSAPSFRVSEMLVEAEQ